MPFKTPLDTRFRGYDGEGIQHFLSLQCPFLKKCRCSTNTNEIIHFTPHPPLPLKGGGKGRG